MQLLNWMMPHNLCIIYLKEKKKKSTEYCFMSQALDLVVHTEPKVEGYFAFEGYVKPQYWHLDSGLLYHFLL